MISRLGPVILALAVVSSYAAVPDIPFYQDRSEQFPAEGELVGATMKKVHVNKDGIVYVLTDRGMARLFGNKLALDRSFRPLNGKKIFDSAVINGEVAYLLEDALISNGFAGTNSIALPPSQFSQIEKLNDDFSGILAGEKGKAFFANGRYELNAVLSRHHSPPMATTLDHAPFNPIAVFPDRLSEWYGTKRGVFRQSPAGQRYDYYASRRWLLDDEVVGIASDKRGNGH